MGNVLRGVILAWLAVGMAAGQIVLSPAPGGGGGGGSSLTIEEADGAPTGTPTTLQFDQADGFTVTDEGAGVFQVDLGNVSAAAMQTNVLSAISSATGDVVLNNGSTTNPAITFASDTNTGWSYGGAAGIWSFVSKGAYLVRIADFSQVYGIGVATAPGDADDTFIVQDNVSGAIRAGFRVKSDGYWRFHSGALADPAKFFGNITFQDNTATTGVTSLIFKGGAGQSTNPVFTVENSSGTANATILESGAATVASITMAATGATFYGASANEPVSCSASIDGSIYFDTTDQKLCICANDGTDDEWLMSDDYSHLTGHCSL